MNYSDSHPEWLSLLNSTVFPCHFNELNEKQWLKMGHVMDLLAELGENVALAYDDTRKQWRAMMSYFRCPLSSEPVHLDDAQYGAHYWLNSFRYKFSKRYQHIHGKTA